MAGANLIKFAVWPTLPGRHLYNAKMVCFGEGAMELCMRENAIFYFFLSINTQCDTPAFLAT